MSCVVKGYRSHSGLKENDRELLTFHRPFHERSLADAALYSRDIMLPGLNMGKSDHVYPLHKVDHFQQRWHWDCGVSCVLMLLSPHQRDHFLKKFQHVCTDEGLKESTWTIDLCYLLKRFGIKHTMYTTLAGVNEDYRNNSYYRNVINFDCMRVERRFKQASTSGIQVLEQHLSSSQLVDHLRTGPAIILVDAGLLTCDICKHNKLKSEFRRCIGGDYKGHYILVVGLSRHKVVYRDPALPARLCATSPARLRQAASAHGTDDDCILVYSAL